MAMPRQKIKSMTMLEFDGVQYFTPFEDFKQTPADFKLLLLWQKHYLDLGIRTKVVEEQRKSSKSNVLYVNYADDQKLWARELGG